VDITPLAITNIAATVMTPPLLNPAKSSSGRAIPSRPAITSAQASASTAGALPVVITTKVTKTITAAAAAMARNLAIDPQSNQPASGFERCRRGRSRGHFR